MSGLGDLKFFFNFNFVINCCLFCLAFLCIFFLHFGIVIDYCYCETLGDFMDGFDRPQSHNSMASTVVVICVITVWCLMVFWTGGSPQFRTQCKGVKGARAGCRGGGAGRRCTSVDKTFFCSALRRSAASFGGNIFWTSWHKRGVF